MSRTRTFPLFVLTALAALALMLLSSQSTATSAAQAQTTGTPSSDFPVSMQIAGTIQTLTHDQLVLDDGSIFIVDQGTDMPHGLHTGQVVTVQASFDEDDSLVADSITLGDTTSATPAPTSEATQPSDGKGHGHANGAGGGNGNNDNQGEDNGNNGNGHGNANGNGNGNGNGHGHGKGHGGPVATQPSEHGKETKTPQDLTTCLNNTHQPVAQRLATAFNVSFNEIMTWHCKGNGFGEIARAYALAQKANMPVEQIFAMRDAGQGWGEILHSLGISPHDIASLGKIMSHSHQGNKGNTNDGTPYPNHQGDDQNDNQND